MDNKKIAELVNLALENDQNAFTKLYELTYKSVYTTISLKADDTGDIESILQDTYIKAFKKLNTLKNPESFCGWIKVIALNTARNFNKSHKKQIYLEDLTDDKGELNIVCDDKGAVPENVIDEKETVRLIKEMVQGLKDNQKLAITLFYYEKMSVKEIAQVMHCSENTVLSRLRLGREKLHAKIEELEKKGIKLYGIEPVTLLMHLMNNYEKTNSFSSPSVVLSEIVKNVSVVNTNVNHNNFLDSIISIFRNVTSYLNDNPVITKNAVTKAVAISSAVVVGGTVATYTANNNNLYTASQKPTVVSTTTLQPNTQTQTNPTKIYEFQGVKQNVTVPESSETKIYEFQGVKQNVTVPESSESITEPTVALTTLENATTTEPQATDKSEEYDDYSLYLPRDNYEGKYMNMGELNLKMPDDWDYEELVCYRGDYFDIDEELEIMNNNEESKAYYSRFRNTDIDFRSDWDIIDTFTNTTIPPKLNRTKYILYNKKGNKSINVDYKKDYGYYAILIYEFDNENEGEKELKQYLNSTNIIVSNMNPVARRLGEYKGKYYYAFSGYTVGKAEYNDYVLYDWSIFDAVCKTIKFNGEG
ncbi:MAG: sigma-70 family RNA polymerase sigma factor [Ruminococcus sp.]|nr:sigma-70 family RNA polymerase sigma factor [Ruminococcus sp.]